MSRDAFVTAALELRGLTEPDPALGALVDPGGTLAHQGQIERLSLCMLVYRGLLLRVLDVPAEVSHAGRPYAPGSIPAILRAILGGSARAPTVDTPPRAGDGIWYEAAQGHPEHVDACVVEIEDSDLGEQTIHVVAGGQRDASGHETIAELPRMLRWQGAAWVCQATDRRVRWVLDADLLAERYPFLDEDPPTPRTGTLPPPAT